MYQRRIRASVAPIYLAAVEGCQLAPRAVAMPCRLSSAATAEALVCPAAIIAATTGASSRYRMAVRRARARRASVKSPAYFPSAPSARGLPSPLTGRPLRLERCVSPRAILCLIAAKASVVLREIISRSAWAITASTPMVTGHVDSGVDERGTRQPAQSGPGGDGHRQPEHHGFGRRTWA